MIGPMVRLMSQVLHQAEKNKALFFGTKCYQLFVNVFRKKVKSHHNACSLFSMLSILLCDGCNVTVSLVFSFRLLQSNEHQHFNVSLQCSNLSSSF